MDFKTWGKGFGSYKYMCKKDEKSNLQNTCNPSGEKKSRTTADEKDRSAMMWSKSEKQEWEKMVQNFQCTKTATSPPLPPEN